MSVTNLPLHLPIQHNEDVVDWDSLVVAVVALIVMAVVDLALRVTVHAGRARSHVKSAGRRAISPWTASISMMSPTPRTTTI